MKTLKNIILPIIVLLVIIILIVIRSLGSIEKFKNPVSGSRNQFIQRIDREIDSLRNMPDGISCDTIYVEIGSLIKKYHNEKRFDNENALDNDQWSRQLTESLFNAYAVKFVKQAIFMFKKTEWELRDLNNIRDKCQTLRKMEIRDNGKTLKLIEKGSDMDKTLTKIDNICVEYNSINDFIDACNKVWSFQPTDINKKIQDARNYQNRRFELKNESFVICGRLRTKLGKVPQILFERHIAFLNSEIYKSLGEYSKYTAQPLYVEQRYNVLLREINKLNDYKNSYNINSNEFDSKYDELKAKWNAELTKSMNYFMYRDEKIAYLKGSELNVDTLNGYKKLNWIAGDLKTGIDLCLEFWDLSGEGNEPYKEFRNKVVAHNILKDSKLKSFLDKVSTEENPSYYTWDKRVGLK